MYAGIQLGSGEIPEQDILPARDKLPT